MDTTNLAQGAASASPGAAVDDAIEFTDKESFNLPMLILWISAVISIIVTIGFFQLNRNTAQDVATKQKEEQSAISQLNSKDSLAIEENANAFRQAVEGLTAARGDQYLFNLFLPEFYKQIDKNVQISNLDITDSGKVAFDATTDSYRSAGLQVLTLQGWKVGDKNVLKNVELLTTSQDQDSKQTKFSISADIQKTVDLSAKTADEGKEANASN